MSKELIIFSDFFSVLHEKINCFLRAGSERPRWKEHPSVAFNLALTEATFSVGVFSVTLSNLPPGSRTHFQRWEPRKLMKTF